MRKKHKIVKYFLILLVFSFCLSNFVLAEEAIPIIKVIYPKENAAIGAYDSTFIFGSVTPGSELFINNFEVKVYKNGGFLAFLPLQSGDFVFDINAKNKKRSSNLKWKVKVPFKNFPVPKDSFAIIKNSISPSQDLVLTKDDILEISFKGTPHCQATFSIDGLVCDVPMAETFPKSETYWGEGVFGQGSSWDSSKTTGVYTGVYNIKETDRVENSKIVIQLRKNLAGLSDTLKNKLVNSNPKGFWDKKENSIALFDTSTAQITVKQFDIPQVVEFIDTTQIVRSAPGLGYLLLFQPQGIKAVATGEFGEWIRVKLSEDEDGWVRKNAIRFLPQGTKVPKSKVSYIRTEKKGNKTSVKLSLQEKLPFRVIHQIKPPLLSLWVYGLISDTDWIRYDASDSLIEQIIWSQPKKEVYQLDVLLNQKQQWGYDVFYEGNDLVLEIRKKPEIKKNLQGLRICLDPGHSPDPGAVGPTGLEEKVVNLEIALKLKKLLEKKGAFVVMTREGMDSLGIYDRPKIAVKSNCDILVSIHNNALPDGVNPFCNNGTSVYYYHPQSERLARSIHSQMVNKLSLRDQGFYYANFALTRPTQFLAVLVECAFIMIPEQEELLRTEEFQKKCVEAICKGIEDFVKELKEEKKND
jgi:N-acetylmuramoyl-L-alanine amidase